MGVYRSVFPKCDLFESHLRQWSLHILWQLVCGEARNIVLVWTGFAKCPYSHVNMLWLGSFKKKSYAIFREDQSKGGGNYQKWAIKDWSTVDAPNNPLEFRTLAKQYAVQRQPRQQYVLNYTFFWKNILGDEWAKGVRPHILHKMGNESWKFFPYMTLTVHVYFLRGFLVQNTQVIVIQCSF